MKKLLLIGFMIISFIGCEKEKPTPLPEPNYSVEGRWIWSPSLNRTDANTMYEFSDGIIYTWYCIICPGDDAYWNSLDSTQANPGTNTYTFDVDALNWYETPRVVTFECDGGKLFLDGEFSHLWRLSSDCE